MRRATFEPSLSGIRVLELASWLSGPTCGQVLADLGADVIKVEPPAGDPARYEPPTLEGLGALFASANRNKRSIVLNLTVPAARDALRRLARTADVLLDGQRPGELSRLGAGYAALAAEATRLVYCSITGYGQDGPYAQRPGRDATYAALAGLVEQNAPRGGAPLPLPGPMTELAGALWAALSVLAALRARDRTGRGQHLDVSLTECAVALAAPQFAASWAEGVVPERGARPAGYGTYLTADGRYLALGALEDRQWRRLCELIGEPALAGQRAPAASDPAVEATLSRIIARRSRDEWIELLADDEVCAAPVLRVDEAPRDPHLVHRGVFAALPLPRGGRLPQVAFPVRLPQSPAAFFRPPPLLGEHTHEVLSELGYSAEEITALCEAGAAARQ